MRKTLPLALLVTLAAFFAVVHEAAAAPVRRHAHAGGRAAAAHVSSKKAVHGAAVHGAATRAHAGGAVRTRSAASGRAAAGGRRHVTKLVVGPRSAAAIRAHGRIRADIARRRHHGRLPALPAELRPVHLSIPAPLRGSHESLVHQNAMAEAEGLERILDDADLADRISHGSLVPVPVSMGLQVNPELPENRRYCRPWTAQFLRDLAKAHAASYAANPIEVTSAVRTVEYQRRLRHINGNAAAADGDIASPHLTGGTIDLAKQGMSAREIGWLRAWLIPLEQQGKIDVEEEFKQSCFHISVYKSYAESKGTVKTPLASGSMLAVHGGG